MDLFTHLTLWHWFIFGIILLVLEVLIGSNGFLLWVGIAAELVGICLWIFPSLSINIQLFSFAIFVLFAAISWRYYLKHHPIKTDRPTLNRRNEQYIGRVFTLESPVINGMGKIIVEDSTWRVRCPDTPAGTQIRIVGVEGVILIGEPIY
ncbi:MAG: NfeD family protein [Gammaproteobacteria bacterium]|nr:NfeD family protein [Gammaproteobacteria bacterium]